MRRFSTALFALLLVGLAVPTLAAAQWSAPVDLSGSGQIAVTPQVAVDADGDAVFTWRRFDGRTTGSRHGRAPRPGP